MCSSDLKSRQIKINLNYDYDLENLVWEINVWKHGLHYLRSFGYDNTDKLIKEIREIKYQVMREETKENMLKMVGLRREEVPQNSVIPKTLEQLGFIEKDKNEFEREIWADENTREEKIYTHRIYLCENGYIGYYGSIDYSVKHETVADRKWVTYEIHKAIEYEMKKRGWWK